MMTLQRLVELVLLITARSRCDAFGVGGERLRLPYPFSSTAANTSPRIVDVDPSNRADDAQAGVISSRRSFVAASAATFSAVVTANAAPLEADAATDCFADCLKNCKLIAPKVSAAYAILRMLFRHDVCSLIQPLSEHRAPSRTRNTARATARNIARSPTAPTDCRAA